MSASPRSASFWLIALNLVLVAVLAALWLAPGTPARWRGWQAPAPQAPTLDDVRAAVLLDNPAASAAYPGVLARPLMSPSRRPQAAAAPDQPAAEPPTAIDQLKLLGIVAGPALNGAMIGHDGQARFVRRGERVGDWTLDALAGREARFVRGDERRSIELPVAHGAAAAAQKGAPAAQAAAPADASPAATPAPSAGAAQARTASPPAQSRPAGPQRRPRAEGRGPEPAAAASTNPLAPRPPGNSTAPRSPALGAFGGGAASAPPANPAR